MFYVDTFAGPGIDLIQETGTKIAGSPILTNIFASKPFSKSLLCEIDSDYRTVLGARMRHVMRQEQFETFGDVHQNTGNLLNALAGENSHYFAFIDPQGLEFNWSTFKRILSHKGDVAVLYNTREVWRVKSAALKEGQLGQARRLDLFFFSHSGNASIFPS